MSQAIEYAELTVEDRKVLLKNMIKDAERQHFTAVCNAQAFPNGEITEHHQRANALTQAIANLKKQLQELEKGGK